MERTIENINEKIENGDVQVYSASDFKESIRNGDVPSFEEVDVVTCGTCGIMSGTSAIFNIIVSEPGSFKKANKIYLNGIPAQVGPCPNELLGSVDCIINGTGRSKDDINYGGGFLFNDLLKGKDIEVEVETYEGKTIRTTTNLDEIVTAHMIGTRNAFKNYTAFVNTGDKPINSIFYAKPMESGFDKISFSGCGDINPLQNDPKRNVIKMGAKILLNGSEGLVLGSGTRSSDEAPNLMLSADLKKMDPYYIGGFMTGMGPEVYDSVAIPIPVLNEGIYNNLLVLNEDVPLKVADIKGRSYHITDTDYGQIWNGHDINRPKFDEGKCIGCDVCAVEENCPTNSVKHMIQNNKIFVELDNEACFGCGICSTYCVGNVFELDTGMANLNIDGENHSVHITSRQSDRLRANHIINDLVDRINDGSFKFSY